MRKLPVRLLCYSQTISIRIRRQYNSCVFPLCQEQRKLLENRPRQKLIIKTKILTLNSKTLEVKSVSYQDGLSLLRVGAVDRGEVGVGVFLLGDRNRWSKAKGLKGLLDEDVSDAVEGRVNEL